MEDGIYNLYSLVYWVLFSISGGEYSFLAKVMTWGFCIFLAMFFYYALFGGAAAPAPATDDLPEEQASEYREQTVEATTQ